MAHKQDTDPKKTVTFRFKESLIEELQVASRASGLTMTAVIESCCEAHIDKVVASVRSDQEKAAKELVALRRRKK